MNQYENGHDSGSDAESNVSEERNENLAIVYDIPTLPAPRVPTHTNGVPTADVYETITQLCSFVEDTSRVDTVRDILKEDPSSALAVFQTLHEMGLLRAVDQQQARQALGNDAEIDSEDDDEEVMDTNVAPGQLLPLPKGARPDLPLGVTSWIGKGRTIEKTGPAN
jgi:hypothetical protein